MYHSILIAVDGSAYSDWGRHAAAQLLADNGTVHFLHVIDIVALEGSFLKDLSGAVGAEPFLNLSPKLEKVLREKGAAVLENQQAACQTAGLTCTTALDSGLVSSVIAKRAVESQLVVVGRHGENEQFQTGLAGSVTESLLRKSPRPVLVVPNEPPPLRRVLLGFDGSTPAAHALAEASRLCASRGLPLTVIIVGDEKTSAETTANEALKFLENAPHATEVRRTAGRANEVIVNEAAAFDLLIVGAHGHSRIVEMVLGSTTEYLLRNSPVPTLFVR